MDGRDVGMKTREETLGEGGMPTPSGVDEISRDEEAYVRRVLGLAEGEPVELYATGKGGSDRSYFRVVVRGRSSVILMRYGNMYPENDVYVAVAAFLNDAGVRTPAIHDHDPRQRLIVMEDLGDVDLYALRDSPWEKRCPLYEKTIETLLKIHVFSRESIPPSLFLMAGYDESLYRWERNYFRENLVRNVCRLETDATRDLRIEAELSGLAKRLLGAGESLIHRDFQSQNVMIKDGEPVVIDFQGLRPGSLFYDLGSLLCDPYVCFPDGAREGLLRFYYETAKPVCAWAMFRSLFFEASAQRLMQALGAYGFLGLQRGKPHFLRHIPAALQNLVDVSRESGVLPELNSLADRCRKALAE